MQKTRNTTKSTQTWLVVCEKWANERKFNPKLKEYEHEDLDKKLQMFYAEVRTKDGLEYEPESLKSMLRAVNVERQSIRVTGHPNEKSLNDYDEGSERAHQDQISSVVFSKQIQQASSHHAFTVNNFHNCQVTFNVSHGQCSLRCRRN